MTDLTSRESELVAIGAALASNCVPCIERVIPRARSAGLTDEAIRAAIRHADSVRQVPARTVLEAALQLLSRAASAGTGCAGGEQSASASTRTSANASASPEPSVNKTMESCRGSCSPGRGVDGSGRPQGFRAAECGNACC